MVQKLSNIYKAYFKKVRGKASQGFVRPTLSQFFMTHNDFYEIPMYNNKTTHTFTEFPSIASKLLFISNDGSDTNDGSYSSPFKTINMVGDSRTVIMKEGEYTEVTSGKDYNTPCPMCFWHVGGMTPRSYKSHVKVIGEDGVVVYSNNLNDNRDHHVFTSLYYCFIDNITVNREYFTDTNYSAALVGWSDQLRISNTIFNIQGTYSYHYNNDGGSVYYDNCTFNGGNLEPNYYYAGTVINATSSFNQDDYILKIDQSPEDANDWIKYEVSVKNKTVGTKVYINSLLQTEESTSGDTTYYTQVNENSRRFYIEVLDGSVEELTINTYS